MKNLYIDFDGVIMNTIEITYNEFKKLGLSDSDPKDKLAVKKYYTDIDWEELLNRKAVIINDAINCIQKIIDSGLYEVTILSHVTALHEAVEKIKYIRKYFNDITIIPVPREISKTKMVHTKGNILIDDFAGNLTEWESEGGIGIKFSTELKGKGFTVIDRLDKILDLTIIDN
jgi:hypothetical protein